MRSCSRLRDLLLLMNAACATSPATTVWPSQSEWLEARARLEALRQAESPEPFVQVVRVSMREPRTGSIFAARGAIAVDPNRAVRMVLLGPGGETALDVWVTHDRWRVAIPLLDKLERGGSSNDRRTFPVGFFRWWFLSPLGGRLLAARAEPKSTLFVLRSGAATVELCDHVNDGVHVLEASRREGHSLDRVVSRGYPSQMQLGGEALYTDETSGVRVAVTVESLSPEAPDPAAFVEPTP